MSSDFQPALELQFLKDYASREVAQNSTSAANLMG